MLHCTCAGQACLLLWSPAEEASFQLWICVNLLEEKWFRRALIVRISLLDLSGSLIFFMNLRAICVLNVFSLLEISSFSVT